MNYSTEQILALAPDPASAKAGRSLAVAAKWQNVGRNARALWGECQGSGSKPYQTVIDLNEPAFKCSCPSRKFPCKHGLGLFLLCAAHHTAESAAPAWAAEWLAKRDQQTQRKSETARKTAIEPDEVTQARRESQRAKRSVDREAKVAAGLKELELWLRDLLRHGLASAQSRPVEYWDQMAARLIDAQAPGAARHVRELSTLRQSGEGWIERVLQKISALFLLLKAYERVATLPAATQADVRTAVGWTHKEEELPADNLASDDWLVLGQRTTGEESLQVHRTWLWGKRESKGALILEFTGAGQRRVMNLIPGTHLEAELAFYPGNYPLRAVVRNRLTPARSFDEISGYATNEQLLKSYAQGLARNPWLEAIPAPMELMIPVRQGDRWYARDHDERLLPMRTSYGSGWKLAALSGGRPLLIFGEWNGRSLLPLSAWANRRHVQL
jgi:hypothetical protein